MCQAYEGERASIVAGEEYNTCRGYAAFKSGQPFGSNPNYNDRGYDYKAWAHGWNCGNEGIVPYAVEERDERMRAYTASLAPKRHVPADPADIE